MANKGEFGVSKRERRTLIYNNFEFWKNKNNHRGHTLWMCCKKQIFKCPARLTTDEDRVIGNETPEHNHSGNISTALARKAFYCI